MSHPHLLKQLLPDRVLDSPHAAVTLINDVLLSWSDRWLLVFDNLDNPSGLDSIFSIFPSSCCGSILITSRYAGSKELGRSIEIDRMEKEESLQLLLFSSGVYGDELSAAEEIFYWKIFHWPSIRHELTFQSENFA